jgi:hypothetical protein
MARDCRSTCLRNIVHGVEDSVWSSGNSTRGEGDVEG